MPPPTQERRDKSQESTGSRSSSRIASRRGSVVSDVCASERMETDEQRKRKRGNESTNECGRTNVQNMRAIGEKLREFMFHGKNLVAREVCKYVLDCVCELEDQMLDIILENERLRGINEAKQTESIGANVRKNVGEKATSYASVASKVRTTANVSVSEKHAVVVRPSDPSVTSVNVKEKVMKDIQPNLKVRVNAVRMLRSGGIAIETASKSELDQLKKSKLFEKAGLTVAAPRKIGPKIIIYDVPAAITTKDLMAGMYERNLNGVVSENEMRNGVRVVSRGGKKDSTVENVVVELPGKAWKHLVSEGRVYVEWQAFKVKEFELVHRCYGCYGFGHRLRECKEKTRVCKKCGQAGHVQSACKNERETCRNCKARKLDSEHSVMSAECPEYLRALERMRSMIHYE